MDGWLLPLWCLGFGAMLGIFFDRTFGVGREQWEAYVKLLEKYREAEAERDYLAEQAAWFAQNADVHPMPPSPTVAMSVREWMAAAHDHAERVLRGDAS